MRLSIILEVYCELLLQSMINVDSKLQKKSPITDAIGL